MKKNIIVLGNISKTIQLIGKRTETILKIYGFNRSIVTKNNYLGRTTASVG